MYYFGLLRNTKTVEIFRSNVKPDYKEFGKLYGFCFGGYKTRVECNNNAMFQYPYATIRNMDMRTKESKTDRNLYLIAKIA